MPARQSARQLDARRRAREHAAAYREREDRLTDLAAEFFVADDTLRAAELEVEAKIEALRNRVAAVTEQHGRRTTEVIVAMLATGESISGVAGRLGMTVTDVRTAKASAASSSSGAGSTTGKSEQTSRVVAELPRDGSSQPVPVPADVEDHVA